MHEARCICALVPSLVPATRVVVIAHYREARKPTNTGLLAARALANSRVEIVGDPARPIALPIVAPGERAALLFPSDDARPIAELAPLDVLVVPDGNWRQAAKMRARVPGLAALPCATLPDAPPTRYRLRAEPRAGGMATLEAIAHALHALDGDAIADPLLALFDAMVERTLELRSGRIQHPGRT